MIDISLIPPCKRLAKVIVDQSSDVEKLHCTSLRMSIFELPERSKRRLLHGLRYQSLCSACPQTDETAASFKLRHCTRLALRYSLPSGTDDLHIAFDVVVAAPNMERWQDICLSLGSVKSCSCTFLMELIPVQTEEASHFCGRVTIRRQPSPRPL